MVLYDGDSVALTWSGFPHDVHAVLGNQAPSPLPSPSPFPSLSPSPSPVPSPSLSGIGKCPGPLVNTTELAAVGPRGNATVRWTDLAGPRGSAMTLYCSVASHCADCMVLRLVAGGPHPDSPPRRSLSLTIDWLIPTRSNGCYWLGRLRTPLACILLRSLALSHDRLAHTDREQWWVLLVRPLAHPTGESGSDSAAHQIEHDDASRERITACRPRGGVAQPFYALRWRACSSACLLACRQGCRVKRPQPMCVYSLAYTTCLPSNRQALPFAGPTRACKPVNLGGPPMCVRLIHNCFGRRCILHLGAV